MPPNLGGFVLARFKCSSESPCASFDFEGFGTLTRAFGAYVAVRLCQSGGLLGCLAVAGCVGVVSLRDRRGVQAAGIAGPALARERLAWPRWRLVAAGRRTLSNQGRHHRGRERPYFWRVRRVGRS